MKQISLGLLTALLGFLFLYSAQAASQTIVKVRMATTALPLRIEHSSIMIQGQSLNNVSIEISQTEKIWSIKTKNKIQKIADKILKLSTNSGTIKIGIHQYPSPVFLHSKNGRSVNIILSLDLEKYLEGVISAEMSPSWPLEALKAQAVASRTYTYYQLKAKQKEVFQLEGDVLDQVYSMQSRPQMQRIHAALEATRGQILTQKNLPIKAYYHSDCGGETEDPQNVWGVNEFKFSQVKDKKCAFRSRWSYRMTKQSLLSDLQEKYFLPKIEKVEVVSRTPSRRVSMIALSGSGQTVKLNGQELRQILGFAKIKSTLFSLTTDQDSVTFTGQGNGHGSGLCQWGAKDLSLEGKAYGQILNHYYPHARLEKLDFENQRTTF